MTHGQYPKFPHIDLTESMAGRWTYCCRCDEEGIMVPKSPGQWECIKCGLGIIAKRIEQDIFLADQDLTFEEIQRHGLYCVRLANEKIQHIMNPPPMPFRMRILLQVARVLRVEVDRMRKIGGNDDKENQTG